MIPLLAYWQRHGFTSGVALPHIDELMKIMRANQTTEDEKMRIMIAAALGNVGRLQHPDGVGKHGLCQYMKLHFYPNLPLG